MLRIESEKRTIEYMIRLHCRLRHGKRELCPECAGLLDYALGRLSACRYGESKTSCRTCPTHCYRPSERERIRAVMRYTGPRMLLRRPLEYILHDRRNRRPHSGGSSG